MVFYMGSFKLVCIDLDDDDDDDNLSSIINCCMSISFLS